MYCPRCGSMVTDEKFCPQCGYQLVEVSHDEENEPSALEKALSGGGALVLTIVFTLALILSLGILSLNSEQGAVSLASAPSGVISILYAIALWLIYINAKTRGVEASLGGLKLARGTLKAEYIINWIAVGLIALAAIGLLFVPNLLFTQLFDTSELDAALGQFGSEMLPDSSWIFTVFKTFISVVLLLAAILTAVLNLCFMRKLLKFAGSLIDGISDPTIKPYKAHGCHVWLTVLGILAAISAVLSLFFDPVAGITMCLSAAAEILAASVIKRNLCDKEF